MKEAKKPVSFRLSSATQKQLLTLSSRYDVSQAQLLTVLIHLFSVHGEVAQADAEAMLDALAM